VTSKFSSDLLKEIFQVCSYSLLLAITHASLSLSALLCSALISWTVTLCSLQL
jgi:hypothetical protein